MRHHRFSWLLGALTLLIVSAPLVAMASARTDRWVPATLTTVFFALMLIAAVGAVSQGRAAIVAAVLAVPWCLLSAGNVLGENPGVQRLQHVFSILFLLYIIALLLKFLFSIDHVSFDTISASLCVYILFGVLWAVVFSLVDSFGEAAAFATNVPQPHLDRIIQFEGSDTTTALYYSFVTMSTLGYGDIIPVSPMARMLSAIEAMMGQMYLAVLVARLVGLHIAQKPRAPA